VPCGRAALAALIGFIAISGSIHAAGRVGNQAAFKAKLELRDVVFAKGVFVPNFAVGPDSRLSPIYLTNAAYGEFVIRELGEVIEYLSGPESTKMRVTPIEIGEWFYRRVWCHGQGHGVVQLISGRLAGVFSRDHDFNRIANAEGRYATLDGENIGPQLAFGCLAREFDGILSCLGGPLCRDGGLFSIAYPVSHVAQLPDEKASLDRSSNEEKAGHNRKNPRRYNEAPFVRRFFTALLFLPFGFGCSLFGGHYLYRARCGLGASLIGIGGLLFCMGGGVVMLSRWPATWGWWI
jgi:hypothetical protein